MRLSKSGYYKVIKAPALGQSMLPLISNPCRLYVNIKPHQTFSPGDIVLFLKAKKLTAHRIIKVSKTDGKIDFLIKGDNNPQGDGYVEKKQLIGKVERIEYADEKIDLTRPNAKLINLLLTAYSLAGLKFPKLFWKGRVILNHPRAREIIRTLTQL